MNRFATKNTRVLQATTGARRLFTAATPGAARIIGSTAALTSTTHGIRRSVKTGVAREERATTGATRRREAGTTAPQLLSMRSMTITISS